MTNPFIYLVSSVAWLLNFLLIIWIVLSWLISFKIVNPYQPVVQKVNYTLTRMFEPMLKPIRRFMPDLGGVDISPIVLILLINFVDISVQWLVYNVF